MAYRIIFIDAKAKQMKLLKILTICGFWLMQDFECDVQVEGIESGEEKKEFSFTFYDLDGYGKITKDVSQLPHFV